MTSGSLPTVLLMGAELKASLRRAEARGKVRTLMLVAPLLLFIVASFALPLLAMLHRAVENPEVADTLPFTTRALEDWDGSGSPAEPVYAALARDLRTAQTTRSAGALGKRINYEISGARTVIVRAAREVGAAQPAAWKSFFLASDPLWASTDFWRVLQRNGARTTPFYLLSSLDLRLDASGSLARSDTEQAIFLDVFGRTVWISAVVTLATLLLGYPIAHLLANASNRWRNLLMLLVLLPFTTSILVRTTAWVVLLQTNGVINDALMWLGLISERVQLIYTRGGTIVAMTHIQLPFTVLPIYSVMKGVSPNHVRAARSLGAGPLIAFWRVYAPQTLPGVGAGCLLTFILSLGYYITPALVGGPLDQMVSYFVALYTNRDINWGLAAALSAVLLVITGLFYAAFNRFASIERVELV